MHNPFKALAISLAAEHERNIENILAARKMERKELTKQIMVDPLVLPPHLLKEVHYLDAYAKIINMVHTAKEPEDMKAADHIEKLFDEVYDWAKDADELLEFFQTTMLTEDLDTSKQEVFQSILLSALVLDNLNNEQRRPGGLELALLSDGSAKSGDTSGAGATEPSPAQT